jgi:hypothetical protein
MSDDGYFYDDELDDFEGDLFWNDDGEIILAVRPFHNVWRSDEPRVFDIYFRTTLPNTPFHLLPMLKIRLTRPWTVCQIGNTIPTTITTMTLLF